MGCASRNGGDVLPVSGLGGLPRRPARIAALLAAAVLAAPACSHDSYLTVTLRSDGTSYAGVTRVVVVVTAAAGEPMATRAFEVGGAAGVTIDATTSKTLSVSFTPERSGVVTLQVSVFAADACLGSGATSATIQKDGVARATVTLTASGCPGNTDGGADAPTTFPGCDPAVAGSCPADETCYIDCSTQTGRCVPAGTRGPGETCGSNNDCAPGTQCFDFGCPTTTRACLKFCDGDDACSAISSAAGQSTCRDPVLCPAMTTYRTCGFACDPRGTATVGCPAGLNCFLYADPAGGQDSPSCGCPAASRVGTDGASCQSTADCAVGFICDQMAAGLFCRRLCKMGSAGDCGDSQTCTALANNTVFGVCI